MRVTPRRSTGIVPGLAQGYPARQVRIVVPFPPGGTSDILARTIGARLAAFEQAAVDNAAIQALAARVEMQEDDGYTARYPAEQVCDMRIVLSGGQMHEDRCTVTKGELLNPHQPAELEAKFMQLGVPVWGEAVARRLLEGCMKLEGVADFSRFSEGFEP